MVIALILLALGGVTAALAPRVLARWSWPEREPVLALWVWQCVVMAVLFCCALAMALSGAAAWQVVRGQLFAPAPSGVKDAYGLPPDGQAWGAGLAVLLACGGVWSAVMLVREIRTARTARRRQRTALLARVPQLPGEEPSQAERLVIIEDDRPGVWLLGGAAEQLMITSGALRRLKGRQLDAVAAHEQGHARARHDWLRYCAGALARGFPGVPVFRAFRDQVHRLVEMAADDSASRRFGRLTTALALVGLNEDRGAFDSGLPQSQLTQRVNRLLDPLPGFSRQRRLRLTAAAALVPVVPLLLAFGPGLTALG